MLTPPLPGQRAEVSPHTLPPGARTGGAGDPPMHEPGSRETALVSAARSPSSATAPATTLARRRRRDLRRRPAAPLREPREGGGGPARRRVGRAAPLMSPTSLFDKIWAAHEVAAGPALHRPAPRPRGHQPAGLRRPAARRPHGPPPGPHARHRRPQRPDRRHAGRRADPRRAVAACRSRRSSATARSSASRVYSLGSERQGIVHVIGPELGVTQPGMTIVCGDSPHRHPRRVRGARVRHRHQRGRARAGHPDARPAASRSRCASATRASSAPASPPRT